MPPNKKLSPGDLHGYDMQSPRSPGGSNAKPDVPDSGRPLEQGFSKGAPASKPSKSAADSGKPGQNM